LLFATDLQKYFIAFYNTLKMNGYNLKEEIEFILKELIGKGYTRADIEKELGYSENYIDQQLSKGGNKRFLNTIDSLNKRVLQKAIVNGEAKSEAKEPEPEPAPNYESRRSLESTLEKLAEDKLRSTAIIERLVSMLESAFGVSGLQLPTPGTPGTRTLTEKDKVNSQKR
jgi:hypothetical protein